jgi:hypothetical protein
VQKFLFSLLASAHLLAAESTEASHRADNLSILVTSSRKIVIREPLKDLLEQMQVSYKPQVRSLVAAMQSQWLRPPGKERWEVAKLNLAQQERFMANVTNLGLVNEIHPTQGYYDYACVLGASVSTIKARFAHLLGLWNSGVRFGQIVFLSGERPLCPEFETREALLENMPQHLSLRSDATDAPMPKNETEAMLFYYQNAQLPSEFLALPFQLVTAKKKHLPNTTKRRPNTSDTVLTWLQYTPRAGSVLAISNQPHIGYQFAVLRNILPKSFELEVVGPAAHEKTNPAIYLDAIARWTFAEVCEFD